MTDLIRWLINFWQRYINPRLSFLIASIGIWGLVSCLLILFFLAHLFEEVWEKEAFRFDQSFLLWLHQYANPNLNHLMLIITDLGNPSFLGVIFLITIAILGWRGYRQEIMGFTLAVLGAVVLSTGLKLFFGKSRPQLWNRIITEISFSFPSGHALGSLVVYGFVAYLLADKRPKFAPLIYILVALLIAAIGLSRLYLGVHWPTDVIAGYGVGFLWLIICIVMLKVQKFNRD